VKYFGPGFPGGFTVLMAVYGKDEPELFAKAVESVYENDLKADYMVLVVDGMVPWHLEEKIIAAEQRYGLEVVRLERNQGLAKALNAGLAQVRTEWVVRADSDDLNLSNRFRRISELLQEHPDLDLIGSAILECERNGTPVARRVMPASHEQVREFIVRRNPFNHMTVAYRRSLVTLCGGYPDIYLREDYALWINMIMAGARCANLPEVLVHATAGRDMYKRRGGWRYTKGEYELQTMMVRLGLKTRMRGVLHGIARSSVFIAPPFLRRLFYEWFLRQRIVSS